MSAKAAIRFENVSKLYRLGAGPQGKGDFRETASRALRSVSDRLLRRPPQVAEDSAARDLWALRDVSFEVFPGEVVGLLGHNGAGKSTLLKILSRITDPTRGEASFVGRLGSLLEVGTGFHPELSGRENIFLNGSILGMTRSETQAKFDEIIDFSGIGRFLDTPVKRYSSGMYVRLAFSVAAHLEPEVLVIDEVLAVGDAAFQRKCLDKIHEVARGGRTILFVSHNMGSVQTLCDRAVVLHEGQSLYQGPAEEAVQFYLRHASEQSTIDLGQRSDRRGRGRTRVQGLKACCPENDDADGLLVYGKPARFQCVISEVLPDLSCSLTILNQLTQRVCRFASRITTEHDRIERGQCFTLDIPEWTLVPGRYTVNVSVFAGAETEDAVDAACSFDVAAGTIDGRPLAREQNSVILAPRHHWTVPGA